MTPHSSKTAFRLSSWIILVTGLAALSWAQQQPSSTPRYYDTFTEHWLNPNKWQAFGPFCGLGGSPLECVREIQNGHLRLSLRNTGATDSDSGEQDTEDDLFFANPAGIYSVTAEVTARQLQLVACPTNSGQPTRILVKIKGIYFNTGSGDPADDVGEFEYLYADTYNPRTITVGNWLCSTNGPCYGKDFATYPVGTPLIATNTWDKANHQFISTVKAKWEAGPGKSATLPYSASDTAPPVDIQRGFSVAVSSLNCTSTRTFSHTEALFDNVVVNGAP